MRESLSLLDITWAVTTVLELALLIALLWRKAYRSYPFFGAYVVSIILQSAAMAVLYRKTGLANVTIWNIAWGTQAAITVIRSLALVELTRKILAPYSGIWALARRLLVWIGLLVLACALIFSKGTSQWVILNAVRGLELAIATVIVSMLLFARYYRLPLDRLPQSLAAGFCLYSVFYVLDYSLLEPGLQRYAAFWNFLGILTFLASLIVWIHAVCRYAVRQEKVQLAVLSTEDYGKLSSEVNLRLYLLNRQLSQILSSEERRP